MPVNRRYHLRKASAKQLVREVVKKFGVVTSKLLGGVIEILELEGGREVILVGGKMVFLRTQGELLPTLNALDRIPLKQVVVDMGAVSHIANGADVMAPGVVSAEEGIVPGSYVAVVDERHGKSLAVGLALVPTAAMKGSKGKVVKNLHYVGDGIWCLQKFK